MKMKTFEKAMQEISPRYNGDDTLFLEIFKNPSTRAFVNAMLIKAEKEFYPIKICSMIFAQGVLVGLKMKKKDKHSHASPNSNS